MDGTESHDWSSVLGECEATAAAAEALLDSRSRFDPEAFAALAAVDLWRLDLGPLPPEFEGRARAVYQHQLALQIELIEAMAAVQIQIEMTSATKQQRKPAQFVDRIA